ncbi:tRNA pseudouridine(55) synthase TruB [Isoptericola sp. b490]|uniref:tRNA pseudouridine(55) synthase TruB n=1 Tax=Actinotalea lenta TaxID=3064654 RepID=UPI002713C0D8|nr:tRNA pseudouridine(55) synthase TruB [Isoptericola sp. b490]MDO8120974.1 tRNA pseudouridine(55) synthase TruB [Isoptericola sp. b490]
MARTQDGPDGIVVIDKPAGMTSHDVVARARRLLHTRKVGHAGTLDPMATGVLVLGVGRGTRLLTYLVGADKEYVATVRLGQATTTDDAEGDVTDSPGLMELAPGALRGAVASLTGPIDQVPSAVSAVKVDGRRAYARVRAGEHVELAARPVVVHAFDVSEPRTARADDGTAVIDLEARVVCSSGTYVRALARDLGSALGVGGHLTALRRTRVGGYGLDVAVPLPPSEHADAPVGAGGLRLLPLADAARSVFPVRELTAEEARELSFGRSIALPAPASAAGAPGPATSGPVGTAEAPAAGISPDGVLVALLARRGDRVRPVLVLAPA